MSCCCHQQPPAPPTPPTHCQKYKARVFGAKNPPRQTQPSMFQLLSWPAQDPPDTDRQRRKFDLEFECCRNQPPAKSLETKPQYKTQYKTAYPDQRVEDEEGVLKKIRENKQDRTKTVVNLIKDRLYYQEEPIHVDRSQDRSHSKKKKKKNFTNAPRPKMEKKVKPKLDENKDKEVIQRRKERIKQFNRQTRNLPNSAFATYFGKPAFEAYGRGNLVSSNGGLLSGDYLYSHNVMPHAGDNHPKHQQTYKSALINANKYLKEEQLPRKRDENYVSDNISETHSSYSPKKNVYHIDIPKPDLINADRFASYPDTPVTVPKVEIKPAPVKKAPVKAPPAKSLSKSLVRPPVQKPKEYAAGKPTEIKKQLSVGKTTVKNSAAIKGKGKQQPVVIQQPQEQEQELKFMNQRQNFINQLNDKKTKKNRLAYKVTECYPVVTGVELQNKSAPIATAPDVTRNPKDYKNIDSKWTDKIPAAGKTSQKHVDIRNVLLMETA